MKKTRSELREKAMIILYQIDMYQDKELEIDIDALIKENMDIENEFVKDLVFGVTTYKESLNDLANSLIDNWTIDRIDKTGASIIRLALFELKNLDTPEIVVINEAIEMSKKYCDESVTKIINAILDRYIKS